MAKIIGIQEIIKLNQALTEDKIPYIVHLRDRCGGQTMWLEKTLEENAVTLDNLQAFLCDYFLGQNIKLAFSDDGTTFWVAE